MTDHYNGYGYGIMIPVTADNEEFITTTVLEFIGGNPQVEGDSLREVLEDGDTVEALSDRGLVVDMVGNLAMERGQTFLAVSLEDYYLNAPLHNYGGLNVMLNERVYDNERGARDFSSLMIRLSDPRIDAPRNVGWFIHSTVK